MTVWFGLPPPQTPWLFFLVKSHPPKERTRTNHQKLNWTLPTDLDKASCDRAIRYSGFCCGPWNVGPTVGDFLDLYIVNVGKHTIHGSHGWYYRWLIYVFNHHIIMVETTNKSTVDVFGRDFQSSKSFKPKIRIRESFWPTTTPKRDPSWFWGFQIAPHLGTENTHHPWRPSIIAPPISQGNAKKKHEDLFWSDFFLQILWPSPKP